MRRSIASFASFITIRSQIEQIVHYRTFWAFCSLTEFRTPRLLSYSQFILTIDHFEESLMHMDHERYRHMHGRSKASMKKASFEMSLKGKKQIAEGTWEFVFEKP